MIALQGLLLVLAMPAAGQGPIQARPPAPEAGPLGWVFQDAYVVPFEKAPYLHPAVIFGDHVDVRAIDERVRARGYHAGGNDRFWIANIRRREGRFWLRLEYVLRTAFPTPPYRAGPSTDALSSIMVIKRRPEPEFSFRRPAR